VHVQEVGCDGVDWVNLAQGRVRWRAVLNVVMKFWFPYNSGFCFQQAEDVLTSELRLFCTWFVSWLVS
jgi:hypothetical protein